MYTIIEIAKILKISRSSVYKLLDSGALGSVHIGGSRRITQAQLDRFLAQLEGGQR